MTLTGTVIDTNIKNEKYEKCINHVDVFSLNSGSVTV